jgi:NADH dehydrogenase
MQILIVGGGYAGVRTALDLERLLRKSPATATITLVDQNPYHQMIQLLHLAATVGKAADQVTFDLAELFQNRNVHFVQGRVQRIVADERSVHLEDGRILGYDRLTLALGATTDYRGVPGALEHTLPLHTYAEALQLREHIIARLAEAAHTEDPQERRILMTTAIVGGGYTGCQFAGELAAWAPELCREAGLPLSGFRIALLEHAHILLRQFGKWATREAERVLDEQGVSVYLDTDVESVEPRKLRLDHSRVLRAGTIVWAGGVRGPAMLRESGLPVDETDHVLVDRYLRVRGQALIFAIGDCARIYDAFGKPVPATASFAMRQGEHMAETLLAEIEGSAPRSYEPIHLGEVVSLGPKYAVGNPMGIPAIGKPALLMKKSIEYYYRDTLQD